MLDTTLANVNDPARQRSWGTISFRCLGLVGLRRGVALGEAERLKVCRCESLGLITPTLEIGITHGGFLWCRFWFMWAWSYYNLFSIRVAR
jgi:hypothetical protein